MKTRLEQVKKKRAVVCAKYAVVGDLSSRGVGRYAQNKQYWGLRENEGELCTMAGNF